MFRRLAACALAAGLVIALPVSALGVVAPEQEQADTTGAAIVWGSSAPVAQTFMPAHSGYLDSVSIYTGAYSDGTSNQQLVTIQGTSAGAPTGSTYASKTITVVSGWNEVVFTSPVAVEAGVTYAIVVIETQAVAWHYTCSTSAYTRGEAMVQDTSWKTVAQYASDHSLDTDLYCVTDFAFRAFITADELSIDVTVSPETVAVGSTGPMTVTISVTNSGTLPTSAHVLVSITAMAIPFNGTTSGCVPDVCVDGITLDMGVIAAGSSVVYTATGTYDATGIANGTTLVDSFAFWIANPAQNTAVGPRPAAAGVYDEATGYWRASISVLIGTAASSASAVITTTPPPTSASGTGTTGGAMPLALLILGAGVAAASLFETVRRRR